MRNLRPWRDFGILLLLSAAVFAPPLVSGSMALDSAKEAVRGGQYLIAAARFELAVHRLPWRDDLWELAGMAAYSGGDTTRAVRLLQSARHADSLSGTGWQVLGSALWESGMQRDAMGSWLAGTVEYPEEAELWDRLAAGHHELRDYESEQEALERRLSIQDDAAARYRLALLLMISEPDEAVRMLEAATILNPETASAAATLQAAARDAAKENPSGGFVVVGRALGLVEEWALAERAFSRAVEADQENPEARAWLGEARQHLGLDGQADLDAAMSNGSDNSVVHALRGLYWRRQGNLGMSLAEYTRASQLEPENAALKSLVGEAHAASGDLVAALRAYEEAVELAPSESRYWRLLAMFSADNNIQVVDLGVAAGTKAVELAPQDPQAFDALGWALAQAGYLFRAEEALVRAIELSPGFAMAHLHLGLTYMRWGQNDKAFQHLTKAVELDGDGSAGQYANQLLGSYFPQQQP